MLRFPLGGAKNIMSYVKKRLESGATLLETLGQLKVGAKEICGLKNTQ
jgi:hypothetical protein